MLIQGRGKELHGWHNGSCVPVKGNARDPRWLCSDLEDLPTRSKIFHPSRKGHTLLRSIGFYRQELGGTALPGKLSLGESRALPTFDSPRRVTPCLSGPYPLNRPAFRDIVLNTCSQPRWNLAQFASRRPYRSSSNLPLWDIAFQKL